MGRGVCIPWRGGVREDGRLGTAASNQIVEKNEKRGILTTGVDFAPAFFQAAVLMP